MAAGSAAVAEQPLAETPVETRAGGAIGGAANGAARRGHRCEQDGEGEQYTCVI